MRKFLLTIMASLSLISTTNVLADDVQPCYQINHETQSNAVTQDNIIMLDVARRHMNYGQIIQCIQAIDPNKFQMVQLHLNDDEDFAVKSRLLRNTNDPYALSRRDLKRIVSYANSKGITIIPDIDVPGHDTAIINDLKQCNSPWLRHNIVMNSSTLNYTNRDTLDFVERLYSEILPAFQWQQNWFCMIGADEVPGNQNCAQQFSWFINELSEYLNWNGFNAVVWNDSINQNVLPKLNHNITVDYWKDNDNFSAQQMANEDYPIKNVNYQNNYINTFDLNNSQFRTEKAQALANQQGSKMLCFWGSNNPLENQVSNQEIVSFIKEVQNDMH